MTFLAKSADVFLPVVFKLYGSIIFLLFSRPRIWLPEKCSNFELKFDICWKYKNSVMFEDLNKILVQY